MHSVVRFIVKEKKIILHLFTLSACIALIWVVVDSLYSREGYSAPVPEVLFDHDCKQPPEFLFRTISEDSRPDELTMYIRVDNFSEISHECSYIDLYWVAQGSKAVSTDTWSGRLEDKPFFHIMDERGFALRFSMDGAGHRLPPITIKNSVHKRSIDHWFMWLFFSPVIHKARDLSAMLTFEFMPKEGFLIQEVTAQNGSSSSVFGDTATMKLKNGQGFVLDMKDSAGEYLFALLNILIGVLASIGTSSLTFIVTALFKNESKIINKC